MPRNDQETRAYKGSTLNQFGAWRFEETALDFMPDIVWDVRDWWMCLTADTPILHTNGIKPVQEVRVGDLVLTHEGRYRSVRHVFPARIHDGLFITLTPSFCRLPVRLTEGHPVLAIPRKGRVNLPEFASERPVWTKAEDLRKGDILCFPRTRQGSGNISPELARLLGYYAAEGCIMYEGLKSRGVLKGVQFTIHQDEWAIAHDINDLVMRLFDHEVHIKHDAVNRTLVLRVFSSQIASVMRLHVPGLAKTKSLSQDLFFTSDEATKQFLCGLFRGDGHLREEPRRGAYSTASLALAMQVFQLCVRHGVLPSFTKHRNRLKNKTYTRYLFAFCAEALDGFVAIWNGKGNIPTSKRIDERYVYLTLDKVKHEEGKETVYNFEVEQDNSYVSSFALHNCEHEGRSPFRPYFHWTLMPTVDAAPQDEQWMASFMDANSVFAYSDWGLEQLRSQSNGRLRLVTSAPPGADAQSFQPVKDRAGLRKRMQLPTDAIIIGTVMRNQPRKLYPDLIQAFARYLREAPPELAKKTYLYLHTAFPDVGWDIPRLLKEHGVGHRTLFTYRCQKCQAIFPSLFQDARGICKACSAPLAAMPNSIHGIDNKALGLIVNLFDVYVQYAICEGFGMPQVEAAACGVPVMSVDYSAMADVVRKLKGMPIPVQRFYRESQTHCYRALPDTDQFLELLINFLLQPESLRLRMGLQSRRAVEEYYTWERTAKIWEEHFDSVSVLPQTQTWLSQPKLHKQATEAPKGLNNEQFVRWGMAYVAGRTDLVNSYTAARMIRDLNHEMTSDVGMGGVYVNEASTLGLKPTFRPFGRNEAMQELLKISNLRNHWEQKRAERLRRLKK
jgi:glycosyltransferase involved in cell wall biosynthesis